MRLTPQVIAKAPIVLNPEGQLTLQLRNLQIPYIENIGVTQDKYSVIDLTNNNIIELRNIPGNFVKLEVILLANNNIVRIGENISSENRIKSISLANNNIDTLGREVTDVFHRVEHLVLSGNPICEKQHYRHYLIWLVPSLKVLDFKKIKDSERAEARKLFGASHDDPTPLGISYLHNSSDQPETKPPSNVDKQLSGVARKLTADEKKELMEKLAAAQDLDEIEAIEATLKSGMV